jgi:mannose/fructose/N-acetylgalactosamine-specific phosphotransferase system component IID
MWMTHWNKLWRLFFLQSSRNDRTIDGLGFLHALSPLFRGWAGSDQELKDTARRHMGYFNANPILASYIVGAVTNLEEKRKAGEDVSSESIERFKETLSAVLTARGDYFFDVVLIPLGLTIGSIFAIYSSYVGPVIFLALYNYYHFQARIGGYLKGVQLGEGLGGEHVTNIFKEQGFLGGCAAFASGAFTALVFTRASDMGGLRYVGWGIASIVGFLLLRRRLSFVWSVAIVFLATFLFLLV